MQRLVDVVPQYRLTGWCCHPCFPTPQRRSASACASGLPQSQSGLLLAVCSFETLLASLLLPVELAQIILSTVVCRPTTLPSSWSCYGSYCSQLMPERASVAQGVCW